MKLLVLQDELAELQARLEVRLKRVVVHELLPLVGVEHLLEDVDPERLLGGAEAGRRHDRAHDEVVVDRKTLRLARREACVDASLRAVRRERAERTKLARGLIDRQSLARV